MIDLGFLMKFLTGVGISALVFLVVESIIKVTTIQDNNQRSNLYSIALLSCFSSILYAPFLLNVQIHEAVFDCGPDFIFLRLGNFILISDFSSNLHGDRHVNCLQYQTTNTTFNAPKLTSTMTIIRMRRKR